MKVKVEVKVKVKVGVKVEVKVKMKVKVGVGVEMEVEVKVKVKVDVLKKQKTHTKKSILLPYWKVDCEGLPQVNHLCDNLSFIFHFARPGFTFCLGPPNFFKPFTFCLGRPISFKIMLKIMLINL